MSKNIILLEGKFQLRGYKINPEDEFETPEKDGITDVVDCRVAINGKEIGDSFQLVKQKGKWFLESMGGYSGDDSWKDGQKLAKLLNQNKDV